MGNSKYNVIIDTNVLVSAFLSSKDDANTVKVLDLFYDEKIKMYYSEKIYNEYDEVLHREKFSFDKVLIDSFLNIVREKAILIEPEHIEDELIDRKDIPFYELVLDKNINDSRLITGNKKHFPSMYKIVTPKEFMDIYDAENVM